MRQRAWLIILIVIVAVPAAAQQSGWKVRIDGRPSASAADADPTLKVAAKADALHVIAGAGGILWDPLRTVKGVYTVRATFNVLKAVNPVAQYGLVFGGKDFEGATPTYVYFTVAADGTYRVRHREARPGGTGVLPHP